ncbi:uncharacterized protein LOC144782521 isoform X2 [Lissotriton helveticus]
MSRADSDQAHAPFQDAAAHFSEEEWRLLQDWQQELCRNLMKEIHQALISLGPLIAATVSSLRGKERPELLPLDGPPADPRTWTPPCPGNKMADADVLLRIIREDPQCLSHPEDSDWRRRHQGHRAEPEVVLFRIKDEDETYCKEHPASPRTEAISSARDEPEMRKKRKSETFKSNPATASEEMPVGNDKVKMFHVPETEGLYHRQLWPDIPQELEADETSQCNSGFSKTALFHLLQENPQIQRSEGYDDCETNTNHQHFTCQSNIQGQSHYSCVMCDKSFSKKDTLFKHKRIHLGLRPYQCNECEKSFIRNDNLIVHMRTHTGERPYHCNMCEKSFSQKGILSRHQATHAGEKPYQCTECEKSFNRKGNLIAHQKIHIQNRLPS